MININNKEYFKTNIKGVDVFILQQKNFVMVSRYQEVTLLYEDGKHVEQRLMAFLSLPGNPDMAEVIAEAERVLSRIGVIKHGS